MASPPPAFPFLRSPGSPPTPPTPTTHIPCRRVFRRGCLFSGEEPPLPRHTFNKYVYLVFFARSRVLFDVTSLTLRPAFGIVETTTHRWFLLISFLLVASIFRKSLPRSSPSAPAPARLAFFLSASSIYLFLSPLLAQPGLPSIFLTFPASQPRLHRLFRR